MNTAQWSDTLVTVAGVEFKVWAVVVWVFVMGVLLG